MKKTALLFMIIALSFSNLYAEIVYKSEDYLHYLEFLRSENLHNVSPVHYKNFEVQGLELRPRIFELMRRVGLNRSAFSDLDNEDLSKFLISQIDIKTKDKYINDGLIALRIVIAEGDQIIRILFFERENSESEEINLMHWKRNFKSSIDLHPPPSDWAEPTKLQGVWNSDSFFWLNEIFSDPMPPVDFASEIIRQKPVVFIVESVIMEDGSPNYKWAIRSSLQTSGYLRNFTSIFDDFLKDVNTHLDKK